MKRINKIFSIIVLISFVSCTHEFPPVEEPSAGTADFTKLVSVGNSLTAGFLDNALYQSGQDASFPAILARQMQEVGGGNFNSPDVELELPNGRLVLADNGSGPAPTPIGTAGLPAPYNATQGNPTAYGGDKSALNNFGVPGMSLGMSLLTIPNYPPGTEGTAALFGRFAADPATSTQIGDAATALANGGTFFTFWLGNIDVLGYAVGGASNPALLTSSGDFNTFLGLALGALTSANATAKGAVANIPNVTDIAYFTTVAWNPIPLDQANADALNANYAAYNAGLGNAAAAQLITQEELDLRTINFVAGSSNGFVIDDDLLTDLSALGLPNYRMTKSDDLVVLPAAAELPGGLGTSGGPAADQWVLTGVTYPNGSVSEAQEVLDAIETFNGHIQTAVDANDNLVLVDVNSAFDDLATNGASINGSAMNATLSPPFGGFSLDGVHPNKRGYAYVANLFIEAINSEFGSQIPLCNPNDYAGNNLPIPY